MGASERTTAGEADSGVAREVTAALAGAEQHLDASPNAPCWIRDYERTGDNERAVGAGLAHTGRPITGAAAIMAGVFFGFGLADTVVIKAIGIGMGIAVR